MKVKSKDLAEMLQWVREVFDNKVVRWMPEGVLGTYEADPLVGSIEIWYVLPVPLNQSPRHRFKGSLN